MSYNYSVHGFEISEVKSYVMATKNGNVGHFLNTLVILEKSS